MYDECLEVEVFKGLDNIQATISAIAFHCRLDLVRRWICRSPQFYIAGFKLGCNKVELFPVPQSAVKPL